MSMVLVTRVDGRTSRSVEAATRCHSLCDRPVLAKNPGPPAGAAGDGGDAEPRLRSLRKRDHNVDALRHLVTYLISL